MNEPGLSPSLHRPAWGAGTRSASASVSGSGSRWRSPGSSGRTSSGSARPRSSAPSSAARSASLIGDTPETIAGAVGGVLGRSVGGGSRRRCAAAWRDAVRRRRVHGSSRRADLPDRARSRVAGYVLAVAHCRSWPRACAGGRRRGSQGCERSRSDLVRRSPPARAEMVELPAASPRDHATSASSSAMASRPRELLRSGQPERSTPTTTERSRSGTTRRSRSRSSLRRSAPSSALHGSERVLDVGTGSGYQAAGARRARRGGGHDRAHPRARRRGARGSCGCSATRTSRSRSATARSACQSARRSTRDRRRGGRSDGPSGALRPARRGRAGSSFRAARVGGRSSFSSCGHPTARRSARRFPAASSRSLGDEGFGED